MMKLNDIFVLTEEIEKELWKNCVFVFDSSALLDFYLYPELTSKEIFTDVFDKIKSRLWIPSQVEYEYFTNRISVIKKPIKDKYDPIIELLDGVFQKEDEAHKILTELKEKTQNAIKHPHIAQSDILNFIETTEKYEEKLKVFDENVRAKIAKQKKDILNFENNDTVLTNFNNYFQVGPDYTFEKKLEIATEGKIRYEFRIPPGYKDEKEKKGLQIFGDLIIWKQILDHAIKNKTDIVFVCNDLKEDWCVLEDNKTEKRIKSPREELIKEFSDLTGKRFWMYSLDQFIFTSNKVLGSKITKDKINQIFQELSTPKQDDPDSFLIDIMLKNTFRLVFLPSRFPQHPEASKIMRFSGKGIIAEGNNANESSWRIKNGLLELLNSAGNVFNRFNFVLSDNRFNSTNDKDTVAIQRSSAFLNQFLFIDSASPFFTVMVSGKQIHASM